METQAPMLIPQTANGLQCLHCRHMPKPEDCRIVTTCGSQCYVEQVVSSGGLVLYNLGCLSASNISSLSNNSTNGQRTIMISRCKSQHSPTSSSLNGSSLVKRQGTASVTDIVTCVDCCDVDFCNIEGCTTTAKRQPQRPPMCFSCMSQLDPQSCRDFRQCAPDQMCALIETVPYSSHQWSSQCAPKLQCQILGNLSLAHSGRLCYRCCQDDFCNNECNSHTSTHTMFSSMSAVSNTAVTKPLASTVTIFTPTKHKTTILSPTVAALTPTKYPQSTRLGALTTTSINSVNKTKITDHTTVSKPTSVPSYTSVVTSTISDKTQTPYSTVSESTSTTRQRLTSNSIHTSPPVTHTSNAVLSTTPPPVTHTSNAEISTTSPPVKHTSNAVLSTNSLPVTHTTNAVLSTVSSTIFNQTSISANYSKKSTLSTTSRTVHTSITPNTTDGCSNRTFDVCLVIDSSDSLGQTGFHKELQFISELVKSIAMKTLATTHFCVVTFSTKAHVEIRLRRFSSVDQVINAIGTIPYRTGERHIYNGLRQALHEINRQGRLGAEKEIILITDGKSNNPQHTLAAAEQIQQAGIDLYAVGVGSQTSSSELRQIVNDTTHVFEVQDIDHLHTSYNGIVQALCKSCMNRTFDVCFVIDSTGSLGQTGFHKELQFISELVKSIAIETMATTHFCVVTFSSNAHVVIKLTKYSTADQVINAIGNITYRTGNSYTQFGLRQALQEINRHGRLGAEKEIILITDGKSHNPHHTLLEAMKIQSEGVDLYAVGVGSQTNISELRQIVSDKTHVFEVQDIDHLRNSYNGIKQALCKSKVVSVTGIATPKTTTARHLTSTTSHKTTTAPPLSTTTSHKTTTTSKKTTTASPLFTSTSHKTTTVPPLTTTTSHKTTTAPPLSTTTSHKTTTARPLSTTTSHKTTTAPPLSTTTSYKTTTAPPLSTTTMHKTTTAPPLSTTTSHKTTTAPPLSTTTSHKTTTTPLLVGTTSMKQPYTVPPNSILCASCSGPEFLCEKLYEMKTCDPPNNYCVNKLSNHRDGTRMVTRGCAGFQTCYRDWFLGSSDSDKCRKFDQNNIITLEFDCTYCCLHDNCNVQIRPDDATLYKDL